MDCSHLECDKIDISQCSEFGWTGTHSQPPHIPTSLMSSVTSGLLSCRWSVVVSLPHFVYLIRHSSAESMRVGLCYTEGRERSNLELQALTDGDGRTEAGKGCQGLLVGGSGQRSGAGLGSSRYAGRWMDREKQMRAWKKTNKESVRWCQWQLLGTRATHSSLVFVTDFCLPPWRTGDEVLPHQCSQEGSKRNLVLNPHFSKWKLASYFPYENYFYQLCHQQVSPSPGTAHTTSTGLPQLEIYPFCLLPLASCCLEEELGVVLCCSMHSPWHCSGGAALWGAPKTPLLFCRPSVVPVKLFIAQSSFAAEWKEPEGSLVSFHHFLISS